MVLIVGQNLYGTKRKKKCSKAVVSRKGSVDFYLCAIIDIHYTYRYRWTWNEEIKEEGNEGN